MEDTKGRTGEDILVGLNKASATPTSTKPAALITDKTYRYKISEKRGSRYDTTDKGGRKQERKNEEYIRTLSDEMG